MKTKRGPWLVPLICLIPFLGWWMYGLFDLDEGFYASVVAEMTRRGEWITPLFDGKPWFEKPILLYWLARPCFMIFGGEFGIRLPSVLASIGTCLLIYWFGKRRLSLASGEAGALVLATSLLFAVIGRMMLVDPTLVFCLTGVFVALWESLVGDKRWRLACAAFLGLAILAKGPVSGVFFIAIAGYTFWRERDLRPSFRGFWFLGTLILVGVVCLWYLPAYLIDGHLFVQKFLIEQNLQRFKGGDEAHSVPMPGGLIYYVPILLLGMIPWSLWIPKAWPKRGDTGENAPLRRYLATWAAVVLLFFTVSGTKLPTYVLPAFPPLALLVGHFMAERWQGVSNRRLIGFASAAAVLMVLATFGFHAYAQASQIDGRGLANFIAPDAREMTANSKQPFVDANVVAFRLTRGDNYPKLEKPSMLGFKIGVNEVSAPSLYFYLDSLFERPDADRKGITWPVVETDRFDDIPQSKRLWLVTRPGRLIEADQAKFARDGYSLKATYANPNGLFVTYEFDRLSH